MPRPDPKDLVPMNRRPKRKREAPVHVPVFWRCQCTCTNPRHINYCGGCGQPKPTNDRSVFGLDNYDDMIYRNITRR